MESEKVKEIKKALQQEIHLVEYVDEQFADCVSLELLKDTLTLINELESENERLNNELKRYKTDWLNSEKMHLQAEMEETEFELFCTNKYLKKVREENKQLKDRIAELEKENGELKQHITEVEKGIINIARERNKKEELASKFIDSYNDSLKQFAEMLKEKTRVIVSYYSDHADKCFNGISEKEIDETLKEFLE